jgi:hypothetical protein
MQCASATFCTVARRLRAFPVVFAAPGPQFGGVVRHGLADAARLDSARRTGRRGLNQRSMRFSHIMATTLDPVLESGSQKETIRLRRRSKEVRICRGGPGLCLWTRGMLDQRDIVVRSGRSVVHSRIARWIAGRASVSAA